MKNKIITIIEFTIIAVVSIIARMFFLVIKTIAKAVHYLALKSKIYEKDPLDDLKLRRIN